MTRCADCAICAEGARVRRIAQSLDARRTEARAARLHPIWHRRAAPMTVEFGGGGLKGYWACGFAHVWSTVDAPHVAYEGASMGACVAAFLLCRVSTADWLATYYELHAMTIHDGRCLSDAMRLVLTRTLPEDAHARCRGRLGVWVTHLPSASDVCVRAFGSKDELVHWLCASSHSVCTSPTPTCGAYMDGMVFRYGRHAVERPTLFVALHDVPTDVHPFVASGSIARLVEQGADDALQLLARPRAPSPLFRWLRPPPSGAAPAAARSVGWYVDVLVYWLAWAVGR
jgi:hypothetical protein